MKVKKLTVTIGIPAYNEEKNIKFLIESLQTQRLRSVTFKEIIVISDGSKDNTVSILRSINDSRLIVVDRKKRVGLNQTQNEIVKRTKGDILVILDADVLPKNNLFLQRLITPLLEDETIGIVGANTVSLPSRNILERVLANSHELKQFMYPRINGGNNVYMCHGRARAFSKKLYKKIIWPDNCPEDAYSYFFCVTSRFKFIFNKKASVLFRCPSELGGHILQSNRFIHGKKILENYFGKEIIRKEYAIPKNIMLKTLLHFLFKNPLSTLLYIAINAYIRLFKNYEPDHHSKYEISASSKEVVA
jgi:glycosyltransferase involved in cell wall biosynthesis